MQLKSAIEKKAKGQQGTRTDLPQKSAEGFKPIETREELGRLAGVSNDTIRKMKVIRRKHQKKSKTRRPFYNWRFRNPL